MEEYHWQSWPHRRRAEDWLHKRSFFFVSGTASHVPSLRMMASSSKTGLQTHSASGLGLNRYLVRICLVS